MAAIITSEFRKNARSLFINDLKSPQVGTDEYFIGLGKTDSWPDTTDALGNQVTEYSRQFSAPLPSDTLYDKDDVLQNLMVLVKTNQADIFNVIPRNNWQFDRIYKKYDPTDTKCFDYETIDGVAYYPCYVTSNDRIYLCLDNVDGNKEVTASSTAIPSGIGDSLYTTFNGSRPQYISNGEGYIWTLVSFLDEDSTFYTDQFVNYTTQTDTATLTNIKNSTGGLIHGFKVVNGGSSATIVPSTLETKITIRGTTESADGTQLIPAEDIVVYDQGNTANNGTVNALGQRVAVADFFVNFQGGNGINSIEYVPDAANDIPWKKDYVSVSIVVENIDSNGDVVVNDEIDIIPLTLPFEGIGFDPDRDLPSFYAGIAVNFIGEIDGESPVGYSVDVRQISLVKNPVRNALGDSEGVIDNNQSAAGLYTDTEAYDALKYLTLQNLGGSNNGLTRDYIGRDFIIEQGSTGARAWLDYADNVDDRFYYHQNSDPRVNFKKFAADAAGASTLQITSIDGYNDQLVYSVASCEEAEYITGTGDLIFYENRKPINRNFNQTDEVKLVIQF